MQHVTLVRKDNSPWQLSDFAWWQGGFLVAKLPGGEMTGKRAKACGSYITLQ